MRFILNTIMGLCCAIVIVFTIIICYEVFVRSVFNAPTSWVVEVSSYLFIWMSLLAAAMAIAEDRQLRITFLVDRIRNVRTRALIELLTFMLMFVIVADWVYLGLGYFWEAYRGGWVHSWGRLFVPMSYTRSALPAVGILILVILAIRIVREWRAFSNGDGGIDRPAGSDVV
jgi:TRAP-type C4-dicarboxylate transport system permease small subunit